MNPICQSCQHRRGSLCKKATGTNKAVEWLRSCPENLWTASPASSASSQVSTSPLTNADLPEPADNFCILTCYFNPLNFTALRQNYLRFLNDIAFFNVPVFSAEVSFDGSFLTDAFIKLKGTERNLLWQKERLLNLLAEKLPAKFTKVAWVDADVLFLDPNWIKQTSFVLDHYPVVQLWGNWYHCDKFGNLSTIYQHVGPMGNIYMTQGGHPGGAWAAQRSVFPLYDQHILGGGDTVAIEAWAGMTNSYTIRTMGDAFRQHYLLWGEEAYRKVQGRIACLPGGAIHLYHGTRQNRNYAERWKILKEGHFSPETSIKIVNGLWEFTDPSSRLAELVHGYFAGRQEDDAASATLPDWLNPPPSKLPQATSIGINCVTIPTNFVR